LNIYKSVLVQAFFLVFEHVCHMDDWMAHVELEILAYLRVEAHYVYMLNSLAFPYRRKASFRNPYRA